MKGKLVILSAPSGSGKTTILKHLLNLGLNLEFSISACSREKREKETDGKDYYFISVESFREKISNDEFLEWEEVYKDSYYGTLKSEVENKMDVGKNIIFDIDVKGGLNIKKLYGKEAIAIFIMPPSIAELEKRLKSRSTDSIENISKRIAKARFEIDFAHLFDKIVINDDLEKAMNETAGIVNDFLSSNP